MSDTAIKSELISKRYRLGELGGKYSYRSFREDFSSMFSNSCRYVRKKVHLLNNDEYNTKINREKWIRGKSNYEYTWALKDVSFEVRKGEVIGIIGKNGAGKTTLLKILSRITEPTLGNAKLYGRVGSLLEVGTGFHPELTGRENIFLNGSILGMKKSEIESKLDEIVEFSGIEKFIDTPVKRYSSGMYVRLAFSVAAHLELEIMLIDEVLAVGDFQFQKKCLGKMQDKTKYGKTVLFVSHNMGAIRQLCPNTIWLDNGRIKEYGDSNNVISSYLLSSDAANISDVVQYDEDRMKEFQLRSIRTTNKEGVLIRNFSCDSEVIIELNCQVHRRIPGLYAYLLISRKDGTVVMVSDSFDEVPNPLDDLSEGKYLVKIIIPRRTLGPGDYDIYLNFTSLFSDRNINVDSPGVVYSFRLDDFTSRRGNRRQGHFSTMLSWKLKKHD